MVKMGGGSSGAFDGVVDILFASRSIQQFAALYKKNALVAWRNRRATFLRIIAPMLFLLLALVIDQSLNADEKYQQSRINNPNPTPKPVGPIPSCHEDLYIGNRPCKEIAYSPNTPWAKEIMDNVVNKNSVKIEHQAFDSKAAVQTHLLANPETFIGAVHFFRTPDTSDGAISFILQTNTSVKYFKGDFQNSNFFVQIPLQSAVHREIVRYHIKNNIGNATAANELAWNPSFSDFAHPPLTSSSIVGQVLGPFIFAACMFGFVTQLGGIVMEKEMRLRQALKTMGCTDSAYWLSWMAWEMTLAFIISHCMVWFGLICQFNLFLNNNYGILFFLFLLFQFAMTSLAFIISVFLRKTQVAVYVGFLVFIIGWIMQTVVLFGAPFTPAFFWEAGGDEASDKPGAVTIVFAIFPWTLLAKGFNDLGSATLNKEDPGISWENRKGYCQYIKNKANLPAYDPTKEFRSFDCVMPMQDIYGVYIALWIGFFVLAVYLDNVYPNENGVRRPIWFFLLPSYWFPTRQSAPSRLGHVDANDSNLPAGTAVDSDVLQEQENVKSLLQHRTGRGGALASKDGKSYAVELFGLKKMFAGGRSCCFCCGTYRPDFWAIRNSWFAIEENQLFCLLGPNGAGKTTTINCLTGVLPASAGEALVYGEPISTAGGMDRIRSMMGVCPQFDLLWGELTGIEHLIIYAMVKGIHWKSVRSEAVQLLEKVKLTYAGKQISASYSGGMKRRLSVAIALLGDPKIVYLDEPTTGMDPISRRYVWDIIQEAKVGRAIVLTTHSMEEADILGDRIAIMCRGRLRCIGSSMQLKKKFGAGYQIAVSVMDRKAGSTMDLQNAATTQRATRVKDYFREHLGVSPVEESRAYINFLVEAAKEPQLVKFLQQLESDQTALGISDVQLSLTTLEEVFLAIARQAELEAAQASGKTTTDFTLPDGTTLEIPIGADNVDRNGQTYQVKWAQDDAGKLVVLDVVPMGTLPMAVAESAPNGRASFPSFPVPSPRTPPGVVEV